MVELKNYNIVNISLGCISYNQAENYTKKHIDKSGLIDIVSSLESDVVFYNRMIAENQEIAESIINEIKQLEEVNESRKQYIESNQSDALIKRGLADICFQYEDAEKKIQKLASELSGINRSNTRALKRLDAIQKALYQGKRIAMQFIG